MIIGEATDGDRLSSIFGSSRQSMSYWAEKEERAKRILSSNVNDSSDGMRAAEAAASAWV